MKILKWFVYSVCIFIFGIVVFRFISTATPKELKNYILKSERIEKAYAEAVSAKEDFIIYKLEMRNPFTLGDALYAENVYYLENAENLQFTLRCKNREIAELTLLNDKELASPEAPFKFYLKVSDTGTGEETEETEAEDNSAGWDYVILEPVNVNPFGKDTGRYKYFTISFDGVKIDYANTKVEMYVFMNNAGEEVIFDEDETLARFTVFDINMPKTKLKAKKFKLD